MEPSSQSETMILIPQCKMHRFVHKKKLSINAGDCKIIKVLDQETQKTLVYLNMNAFYQQICPKTIFVRIAYPKSFSFLFQVEEDIVALSIPKFDKQGPTLVIINFERILNDAQILYTLNNVQPEFKAKIIDSYPNIAFQELYHTDNIKKTFSKFTKNVGGIIGSVSKFIGKKVSRKTKQTQKEQLKSSKSARFQQQDGSSKKKFWSNVNLKVAQLWQPIAKKTTGYRKSLTSSLAHSQIKQIQYIKDISKAATKSMNQGFQNKSDAKQQMNGQQYMQDDIPDESKKEQKHFNENGGLQDTNMGFL